MAKCKIGFKQKGDKCVRVTSISKDKTTTGFDTSLTLFSLFGFLVIMFAVFFSVNLSPWVITVLLFLTGAAFMYEGQVQNIRKMLRDGVQRIEVPMLLTIFIGVLVIVAAILSVPLLAITNRSLEIFIGIVALFAFVTIIIQTWIIK